MRYNIHTIKHIPDCIQNLGPLWTHSNFPFESNNGTLTNYVNAPKGVLHQVCGKYSLSRVMADSSLSNNDLVKKFQQCVSINKHYTTSELPIKIIGSPKSVQIKNMKKFNVNQYLFDSTEFLSYNKFMLNNIIYSTSQYSKSKRCNDSVIKLKTNIYGEIVDIITQNDDIYIILKKFHIVNDKKDFCWWRETKYQK